MKEQITQSWNPAKKSVFALRKAGYSDKQLNAIVRTFRRRFNNETIEDASTKYSAMVRSSGPGHDVKLPECNALNDVKERTSHKSENCEERAKALIESQNNNILAKQCAQMVIDRFGTAKDVVNKIFNCVT